MTICDVTLDCHARMARPRDAQLASVQVAEYADLNQFDPMSVPRLRPNVGMGRPMRELHAWRGDGRHVRDAAADAPATRPHDSPKLEVLRDPAVRISKQLEYRKIVEAYEAKHAAGQLKPQEAKPEAASPESRDKPVSKIAERSKP